MKNTPALLRLTAKIVETWVEGDIPEIERDTVLENLRKVYGLIKYADARPEQRPVAEAPVAAAPLNGIREEVSRPAAQPEAKPAGEAIVVAIDMTESPAGEVTRDPETEPSCIVNSEDEMEEAAENILFAESEIPVKPKLDKKVLLSLYGDDPAPVWQKEERDIPAPEVREEPVVVNDIPEPSVSQNISDTTEPVQVLGDVLNNGTQTVGDVYSEQPQKADVASVIGSSRVEGIRKAIGINDKFLIIRNLFDGNGNDYDTVMGLLDEFDNLDDALIYIHENFDWNPDNEAVKLVVDLLTRKFS